MKDKKILKPTLIFVYGRTMLLTMFMMNILPRNSFMKILLKQLFCQYLKVITLLS